MNKYEDNALKAANVYMKRYLKYAFNTQTAKYEEEQYKAVILKLVHSIEKGLSVQDYQYGAGKQAVRQLIKVLESYSDKYDVAGAEYRTALCACNQYVIKNEKKMT